MPYAARTISSRERLGDLVKVLREAVRGSRQDFTEGSLGRALVLLSVPMAIEMSMESAFAVADVFFVARLGPEPVAAVGLTEAMLTVLFAVAVGLGVSTTVMVARRIGEKDPSGAAVAAVQAIALAILLSFAIMVAGILLAPRLLGLMGATPGIIRAGSGYTTVMLGANITIMLITLLNAILRGAGDAAAAMRTMWLANLANLILDPCLIFGWGPFPVLGVTGAAVATSIGRSLGIFYQLIRLFGTQGRLRLTRESVRLDLGVMSRLIRVALGGMFQMLIATASWIGLMRIMATFGSAALAGYTIATRIIVISLMPGWGLSNAVATLVGQNLGAGKPQRAEHSVWLGAWCNLALMCGIGALFVALATPLIRLFSNDAQVVSAGAVCLRTISYGCLPFAFGVVFLSAFNGAGDTFTPTLVSLVCSWLVQIPLAYLLANWARGGPNGVAWAICATQFLTAPVSLLIFRRGKWKLRDI
ncbi:MAG TPA: MATE family efflux transporter [Dongiaceae bacterium]|nr:MATE family efflux transporter [Dongiaceae bacterium]